METILWHIQTEKELNITPSLAVMSKYPQNIQIQMNFEKNFELTLYPFEF